ncbi:hypothetical protein [Amycolatopsis magusensis]|uniref:hypothetical protein n=1 Tax=Amycolatopsis magusensis TaxID=882444 RepID=UPI003798057D
MKSRNTTMLSACLDREIDHREAVAIARKMHGADLMAIAVRGAILGIANRTDLTPYPALELAGEAFVDGLADAGFTVRSWRSIEWLSGAEAELRRAGDHHLHWHPMAA